MLDVFCTVVIIVIGLLIRALLFCTGFFDKAKKKIMGDKETNPFIEQGSSNGGDSAFASVISGYDPSWWEAQDLGE